MAELKGGLPPSRDTTAALIASALSSEAKALRAMASAANAPDPEKHIRCAQEQLLRAYENLDRAQITAAPPRGGELGGGAMIRRLLRRTTILHWVMVAAMVSAFVLGEIATELSRGPERTTVLGWHVLAGLAVAVLAIPLLALPKVSVWPPVREWERRMNFTIRLFLCATMVMLPVLGIGGVVCGGRSVPILAGFALEPAFNMPVIRESLLAAHAAVAGAFPGLLLLHCGTIMYRAFAGNRWRTALPDPEVSVFRIPHVTRTEDRRMPPRSFEESDRPSKR